MAYKEISTENFGSNGSNPEDYMNTQKDLIVVVTIEPDLDAGYDEEGRQVEVSGKNRWIQQ